MVFNDALRPIVRMMCLAMVEQATKRARLHEMALESISRIHIRQPNSYTKSNQQIGGISKIVEALRFRLVVARSEERPKMEQVIQYDKGGRATTGGFIERLQRRRKTLK